MLDALDILRFQRDRDRILTSRAFRRLAGKTQVVAAPDDPLVRTRLTHTLEVNATARAIGRALGLVDPLIEAIALGHDLGHPAFGHAGERALASLVPGGFHHAAQSVRVVTVLEPDLDLSAPVVDGILKHSKGKSGAIFRRGAALSSTSQEALVVRAADLYAYACHDLDDAFLLGVLTPSDVPPRASRVLGTTHEQVKAELVARTVTHSLWHGDVGLDDEAFTALGDLRTFLYERLYEGPRIAAQTASVRTIVEVLSEAAENDPALWQRALRRVVGDDRKLPHAPDGAAAFRDEFATMTDRQALAVADIVRAANDKANRAAAWSFPTSLEVPCAG